MAVSGLHSGAHLPGKEAGAYILKLAASTCRPWAGLVTQRESSLLVSVKMAYQAALQAPLSVSPTTNWTYGGNLLKRDFFFVFGYCCSFVFFFVCVCLCLYACARAHIMEKKMGVGHLSDEGFFFYSLAYNEMSKKNIKRTNFQADGCYFYNFLLQWNKKRTKFRPLVLVLNTCFGEICKRECDTHKKCYEIKLWRGRNQNCVL